MVEALREAFGIGSALAGAARRVLPVGDAAARARRRRDDPARDRARRRLRRGRGVLRQRRRRTASCGCRSRRRRRNAFAKGVRRLAATVREELAAAPASVATSAGPRQPAGRAPARQRQRPLVGQAAGDRDHRRDPVRRRRRHERRTDRQLHRSVSLPVVLPVATFTPGSSLVIPGTATCGSQHHRSAGRPVGERKLPALAAVVAAQRAQLVVHRGEVDARRVGRRRPDDASADVPVPQLFAGRRRRGRGSASTPSRGRRDWRRPAARSATDRPPDSTARVPVFRSSAASRPSESGR